VASAEAELLRQQPVIKRDVILMDAEDVETIDGEHASKASEGTPRSMLRCVDRLRSYACGVLLARTVNRQPPGHPSTTF